MISQREHDEATERGAEDLRTLPRAIAARFNSARRLVEVELNTGYTISFPPERAQNMNKATNAELVEVEVSGVGFGIYFPAIDADLWVPSLARGRFGNDRWEAQWQIANPLEKHPPVFEHRETNHTAAA